MRDYLQSSGRTAGGASFAVDVEGLRESLEILTRAGAMVRGLDTGNVYYANSELRQEARALADHLARTTIVPLIRAGRAPQSAKMAETVRTKADRMPVVRIGAVNPKLSGWRSGRPENRRYRGSLAWGIERGPGPGRPNRYRQPRSGRGYILGPNMALIADRVLPRYRQLVYRALQTAGVDSYGRAA